jgi:hypothetical protein
MNAPTNLHSLAARLARLSPDRRDPEQWHMEKDDIARALRRLARELDHAPPDISPASRS